MEEKPSHETKKQPRTEDSHNREVTYKEPQHKTHYISKESLHDPNTINPTFVHIFSHSTINKEHEKNLKSEHGEVDGKEVMNEEEDKEKNEEKKETKENDSNMKEAESLAQYQAMNLNMEQIEQKMKKMRSNPDLKKVAKSPNEQDEFNKFLKESQEFLVIYRKSLDDDKSKGKKSKSE